MDTFELIWEYITYVIAAVAGIVMLIAWIRIAIRIMRKEKIEVPPVGISNDLPSDITGINKHL